MVVTSITCDSSCSSAHHQTHSYTSSSCSDLHTKTILFTSCLCFRVHFSMCNKNVWISSVTFTLTCRDPNKHSLPLARRPALSCSDPVLREPCWLSPTIHPLKALETTRVLEWGTGRALAQDGPSPEARGTLTLCLLILSAEKQCHESIGQKWPMFWPPVFLCLAYFLFQTNIKKPFFLSLWLQKMLETN